MSFVEESKETDPEKVKTEEEKDKEKIEKTEETDKEEKNTEKNGVNDFHLTISFTLSEKKKPKNKG